MNIEKYTNKLREILQNAQTTAINNNNQFITSKHLLIAMFNDSDKLISKIIDIAGGNSEIIFNNIQLELNKLPQVSGSGYDEPKLSNEVVKILANAEKIANKNKDSFITIERVLQSIVEIDNEVANIFKNGGVDLKSLNEAINQIRAGATANTEDAENNYQTLDKFTKDITKNAKTGKLDPVIGRDEEIRRAMQIL